MRFQVGKLRLGEGQLQQESGWAGSLPSVLAGACRFVYSTHSTQGRGCGEPGGARSAGRQAPRQQAQVVIGPGARIEGAKGGRVLL